ncbi:MAG TPA: hypothetical protein VFA89_09265 [Terriglobales bacterium]|nr:hypothetical protein [Terriglobales bacterium]
MEHRALGSSSANTVSPQSSAAPHKESRNVWILTGYGISGLALFGVLAYYFSQYIAK